MKVQVKPFGAYQTNCYILKVDGKEFIIDPGVDAAEWVEKTVSNPIAIINTHGHFDHIWDNQKLKEKLKVPLVCSKNDAFLLQEDIFGLGTAPSIPDMTIEKDGEYEFEGIKLNFKMFPGHTPGCMAIIHEEVFFSGDFVFQNSIGRTDLPYSEPKDMIKSIQKLLALETDYTIYPGHGNSTTLNGERENLGFWIDSLKGY